MHTPNRAVTVRTATRFSANPSLDVYRKQRYARKNATNTPLGRDDLNTKLAFTCRSPSGTAIETIAHEGGNKEDDHRNVKFSGLAKARRC